MRRDLGVLKSLGLELVGGESVVKNVSVVWFCCASYHFVIIVLQYKTDSSQGPEAVLHLVLVSLSSRTAKPSGRNLHSESHYTIRPQISAP